MHREIHPVNEYPVVVLALCHAFFICASQYIIHHSLHARINLTHEIYVGGIDIEIVNRLKPVERIVHDGVDMCSYGIFATQLSNGAAHAVAVEAQIIVHEVRLYGIARPCPAVALDAINKELACSQVHCICRHLPYIIQQLVVAFERTALLVVIRRILIIHVDGGKTHGTFSLDADEAESFRTNIVS